jgi:hypothetical protein
MTETEHAVDWARAAERSANFAVRDTIKMAKELAGGSMQEAAWAATGAREWANHALWCLDHAVKWGKRMEMPAVEESYPAEKEGK